MDPPASGTAGGGGEDPVIPDASAQDMEVDAPIGGDAHMEIEEPAAQTDGPAARGEPELQIMVSPTVTTAGRHADRMAQQPGRGG